MQQCIGRLHQQLRLPLMHSTLGVRLPAKQQQLLWGW